MIPFLSLKFFKGCQGPTSSIPGTNLFSPVLFYSHILLEHNLPLACSLLWVTPSLSAEMCFPSQSLLKLNCIVSGPVQMPSP